MVIILTFAFFGLLALASFLVFKTRECYQKERLFERIKWCVASKPNISDVEENQRAIELRKFICKLQLGINLDPKFQINESEFGFIENIIEKYQNDLIQLYFNGCEFEAYKDLNPKQFFLVTLNNFFISYNPEKLVYQDYEKYRRLSYVDRPSFYELSDYGLAYNKLLYISQIESTEIGKNTGIYSDNYMSLDTTKMHIEERKVKY